MPRMSRKTETALKYIALIAVAVAVVTFLCLIPDEALAAIGGIAFLGLLAYLTAFILTNQ